MPVEQGEQVGFDQHGASTDIDDVRVGSEPRERGAVQQTARVVGGRQHADQHVQAIEKAGELCFARPAVDARYRPARARMAVHAESLRRERRGNLRADHAQSEHTDLVSGARRQARKREQRIDSGAEVEDRSQLALLVEEFRRRTPHDRDVCLHRVDVDLSAFGITAP
jgi:hypothetical protein